MTMQSPTLVALQRSLQAHVIDGDDAIVNAIDCTDTVPADTRLKIYSDAYRLRLIEALEANFPALAKLLGDEAFSRVTQEYMTIHPSRHFSIRWFGHRLSEFLSESPDYRDQPWLGELANWEWKIATAFDAADTTLITIDDIARVSPDEWAELRFALHPSVQRISLATNVVSIVKAVATDSEIPTPTRLDATVDWLIWRQDLGVQYRSLEPAEAAALEAISVNATFGEMCEVIAEHAAEEDAPLQAASYLKTWLGEQLLTADSQR